MPDCHFETGAAHFDVTITYNCVRPSASRILLLYYYTYINDCYCWKFCQEDRPICPFVSRNCCHVLPILSIIIKLTAACKRIENSCGEYLLSRLCVLLPDVSR